MIVKTLTTYEGYNYGASLQAYALQNYLNNNGHETKIIRYEADYLMTYYAFWYVNPESSLSRNAVTRMIYRLAKWAHRMTTLKRKAVFDYFNHKVLSETRAYKTSHELYVNPPVADLYICGSDQIWNVLYDAGKDPVFYLDFVKKGKKASYAASFSYLDISEVHFSRIQNSLRSFDAVSVREYQGKEFLDKMGISGTWVLDPVFLLDKDEWTSLALRKDILRYEKDDLSCDPYLLIYDFEGNEDLKAFALEYAGKNNLKIYAITDRFPLKYAEKNFKNAGPADFVRMIMECHSFISNSFHGTVFSIIYHKPFFVFNRNRHRVNSRMVSLLTAFDLKNRLIEDNSQFVSAFESSIDWERVDEHKAIRLAESKEYLKNIGV